MVQTNSDYAMISAHVGAWLFRIFNVHRVEFEKLADALLESNFSMLDKYCTLPGKRPPTVLKTVPAAGRPVSTNGRSHGNK